MCSGPVIILKIARQYAAQVTLVEDDNVIQAFTADRTDETLGVGILPVSLLKNVSGVGTRIVAENY